VGLGPGARKGRASSSAVSCTTCLRVEYTELAAVDADGGVVHPLGASIASRTSASVTSGVSASGYSAAFLLRRIRSSRSNVPSDCAAEAAAIARWPPSSYHGFPALPVARWLPSGRRRSRSAAPRSGPRRWRTVLLRCGRLPRRGGGRTDRRSVAPGRGRRWRAAARSHRVLAATRHRSPVSSSLVSSVRWGRDFTVARNASSAWCHASRLRIVACTGSPIRRSARSAAWSTARRLTSSPTTRTSMSFGGFPSYPS
jgi:hypothetical protein